MVLNWESYVACAVMREEKVTLIRSNYHSSHIVILCDISRLIDDLKTDEKRPTVFGHIRICIHDAKPLTNRTAKKYAIRHIPLVDIQCNCVRLNSRRNETKAFCIELYRNSTFTRSMNFWLIQSDNTAVLTNRQCLYFVRTINFTPFSVRMAQLIFSKLIWIQYDLVVFWLVDTFQT